MLEKKSKSYGVNNIAISSILVRKNHEFNEVIKKVNNLLKTLCLEQGFTFICNSAIARAMLWRDGLHLTNESTNMLSNNFLQYLKNVLYFGKGFLQIDNQIWAKQKVTINVLRDFPQKILSYQS